MNLLTFRIIGHPAIPDSSWLNVGRGLSVLKTCHGEQAKALLHMLQTINPPYDFQQVHPFENFPAYASSQQYTKKIIPSKKTAALAIFAASPALVKELSAIDPVFYETDRIELGRRRDHSRWMNFVELSGSTRWSEIEPTVRSLLARIRPDAAAAAARLQSTMATLRGTDRIKDERAVQLKTQLQALHPSLPEHEQPLLDHCLQAVARAQHFRQAREVVGAHLPLFLSIPGTAAGQADRGTGAHPAGAAGFAPFAFLATRLWLCHPDQASLGRHIHQINLRLQTLHPELALHFRVQGKTLFVESAKGSAPLPFTGLPPVERLVALMSALAILHEEIYDCRPIFLLDCSELQLQRQEQGSLLKALHRFSSQGQCLVAPDSDFLALCADAFGEAGKNEDPSATIIPVC